MNQFLKQLFLFILILGLNNNLFSQNTLSVSAGSDVTICSANPVILNAEVSGGESPFSYKWNLTGNAWGEKQKSPTVFPYVTTNYSVTVTDNKGNTATDNVNVFVNPRPLVNAGVDVTICEQNSTPLNCSDIQGGTAPFSYRWSLANSLSNATVRNPIASPTVTTAYYLTVTDSKGCIGTDQVIVTVTPKPVAHAGVDISICPQTKVMLKGTASGGQIPYSHYWSPSGTLSASNTLNPYASPLTTTTYSLTVIDANGCQAEDKVKVSVLEIDSTVSVNAGQDTTICTGKDAQLYAKIKGGIPPFTYQWSGPLLYAQIANPIVAPTVTLNYSVSISDATRKCIMPDYIEVNVNYLPYISAYGYNMINDKYYLNFCKDTTITLEAEVFQHNNITYTYNWTGAGLTNTNTKQPNCHPTATTTYSLTVSDNIGCSSTKDFVVEIANCDKYISGLAFYDENTNCLFDANDKPASWITIRSADLKRKYDVKANTTTGLFQLSVPKDNYTIDPNYVNQSNCMNLPNFYSVDFSKKDSSFENNFSLQRGYDYDLSVALFNSTVFRPGFAGEYIIDYCNEGKMQSGFVTLKLDRRLKNIITDVAFVSKTDSTITWGFSNLELNECRKIKIKFVLPTPAEGFNAGLILKAKAEITSPSDSRLSNNVAESIVSVVNSYDPNDKSVSPMRNSKGDILETDNWLDYTIRFQNTGNAEAINVVVEDEIDTNYFDLSTFRLQSTSHLVKLNRRNNTLIFIFEDIYLPDSLHNEPKSHGYINFEIKRLAVPLETEITNKAAIYFDYNLPIITNTVKSKVVKRLINVTNANDEKKDAPIQVYPNPSPDGIFEIKSFKNTHTNFDLQVFDLLGKMVFNKNRIELSGNQSFTCDLSFFPKGIYFLFIKDEKGHFWKEKLKR